MPRTARGTPGAQLTLVGCALALSAALASPRAVRAQPVLPDGFEDSVVFQGLGFPVAVRFASDGRVFVAEKSGRIKVFSSLSATTPTLFADLRTNVNSYGDRGLLGLALHPNFPATPWVYVLYTLDAEIGGTPPRWNDACPDPPGGTTDGCVVGARLSRLVASGNSATSEVVLIENWCQQFPSHSIGNLAFGGDGALYVSAGSGDSFNFVDYGQKGFPQVNACGDPPAGLGGAQSKATSLGGGLRGQNLGLAGYGRVSYGGKILRVDENGNALPDNPLVGSASAGQDRVIAYGLRQPFRFTLRPGTRELWVGDVGWNAFEEIDRIVDPLETPRNYGWPCFEGPGRQTAYDAADLGACESLYAASPATLTPPFFSYARDQRIVAGEACEPGSGSVSGLSFYPGGEYPPGYDGALFFADSSRGCLWRMLAGAGGVPDPATVATFATGVSTPVDLQVGPGGDLFYVDLGQNGPTEGKIHRIRHFVGNRPPTAQARAVVDGFVARFDGSGSRDPDFGDRITYAWDFDGDGQFDDATAASPVYTYPQPFIGTVSLRVTDLEGASATASLAITVPNTAPSAAITTPGASLVWRVGDAIAFAGAATDPEDGALGADALAWSVIVHHCPNNVCHVHPFQDLQGVAGGSFTAPDHEYPTFLEIRLTATDSAGVADSESVFIQPAAVALTLASEPPGLALSVGPERAVAPFTTTVIVGSTNSVGVETPQVQDGRTWKFVSWSDGGAIGHEVIAPAAATTYVATFASACGDGVLDTGERCDDGNGADDDGCQADCSITCTPDAPGRCDDRDPCTLDACVTGNVCQHPRVGRAGDLGRQSALCTAQPVPAAADRSFLQGCRLLPQAAAATKPKAAARLYKRAARAFDQASRRVAAAARKKKRAVPGDCAAALGAVTSGGRALALANRAAP